MAVKPFQGLFKVLGNNNLPAHGGKGKWPLPSATKPGKWTEKHYPICCNSGWHLTSKPMEWFKNGARLYVAEGQGPLDIEESDNTKVAVARARLMYEITDKWELFKLFPDVALFIYSAGNYDLDISEIFEYAYLYNMDFKHAGNLNDVSFDHGGLIDCVFNNLVLDGCTFLNMSSKLSNFIDCKLDDTHFSGVMLNTAFNKCALTNCSFDNVVFTNVDFYKTDFGVSRISNCAFHNCTFNGCDISKINATSAIRKAIKSCST